MEDEILKFSKEIIECSEKHKSLEQDPNGKYDYSKMEESQMRLQKMKKFQDEKK